LQEASFPLTRFAHKEDSFAFLISLVELLKIFLPPDEEHLQAGTNIPGIF
jgi:hypothetical protein